MADRIIASNPDGIPVLKRAFSRAVTKSADGPVGTAANLIVTFADVVESTSVPLKVVTVRAPVEFV